MNTNELPGANERKGAEEGMHADEILSSGKTPVMGDSGEMIGMAGSEEEAKSIYRKYKESIDLH